MIEEKLVVIDTEHKSINITQRKSDQQPLWTRSDNSFKFSFFQDNCPESLNQASSSSEHTVSQFTFTRQENFAFAFNFQIDPEEDMNTEPSNGTSQNKQQCTELENTSCEQSASSPNTSTSNTSKKKKKKTGKHKAVDNTTKEPKDTAAQEQGGESAEQSTEEQLQRQLDWCIEQLELGMRSQKASTKQKEEASRALKTLRSSKAPLVKKRQLMRAMAGDYRKKMEEEKTKQFKLIQNEIASAQLRAVSELPKKSSFHRKAGSKAPTSESNSNSNKSDATVAPDKNCVFTPSNEEFRFNFF
ncbi:UPF0488 protein C8orf33 homolog [Boleophthalmus pectinirostris]|uniref:UPF0488 protein C8orf33 homolog n=1 Tax=Boleophthalmus pectinirostris TaxID=150288 RepID=UPI000A1C61F7|nr:UPF0488 protein C8orf33 homolog [Boleophthalmus pectinirostris]XP_055006226.1 UPF0488 protein C8orf33 homolog [Boleophthalmus pectinirostris]